MATKKNKIATKTEQINLDKPSDVMAFATNLKELIVQNNLYTNIKGKNYVNVEGWQIAGAFTGALPMVEKVENLSEGRVYKYRAEVSLRDKDNNQVGYGVAICTNQEAGKKGFDEYAVASMAQTRAVGKAYRMKLGWLLKVAGYETTPTEEMDAVVAADSVDEQPKQEKRRFSIRDIGIAKAQLERAKTMDELRVIWGTLGEICHEQEVIIKKDEMKSALECKQRLAGAATAEVVTATRGGEDE